MNNKLKPSMGARLYDDEHFNFILNFNPVLREKLKNDTTIGLCRYCSMIVRRMKNLKHLRTHYVFNLTSVTNEEAPKRIKCLGSRALDYENRRFLTISEGLERI